MRQRQIRIVVSHFAAGMCPMLASAQVAVDSVQKPDARNELGLRTLCYTHTHTHTHPYHSFDTPGCQSDVHVNLALCVATVRLVCGSSTFESISVVATYSLQGSPVLCRQCRRHFCCLYAVCLCFRIAFSTIYPTHLGVRARNWEAQECCARYEISLRVRWEPYTFTYTRICKRHRWSGCVLSFSTACVVFVLCIWARMRARVCVCVCGHTCVKISNGALAPCAHVELYGLDL